MIRKEKYPILDYDDNYDALINPTTITSKSSKFYCNKILLLYWRSVTEVN